MCKSEIFAKIINAVSIETEVSQCGLYRDGSIRASDTLKQ